MDRGETELPTAISRHLRMTLPGTREAKIIHETAISDIAGPIVILGDPGLGKSVLAKGLGDRGNNRYRRAGTFVRSGMPADSLPAAGGRLVIDGLDEVASAQVGGGVDAVLTRLSENGNPPFILTSREADWQGASARVRIEDDYGEPVTLLHLEPFSREDAEAFLRATFPTIDTCAVLDHLADRRLEDIYGNPLTLRMIGEAAQSGGQLPRTRADLLKRSCEIMLREDNPRHQDSPHALRSDEDLLDAAGAVCASVLLCNVTGVYVGPTRNTPEDYLHLSAVQALPFAESAADTLKTRLFEGDGEGRRIPIHRVIAEHLAARWLAACVERGISTRRVRTLIIQTSGVPTSLRGLNAWLAHFSPSLAPACIAADPYAVLRYGNAETLPLDHARHLLRALSKLSEKDPYFRAEDWGRQPAAGLMRLELKNDILALVSSERTPFHLTSLLLEAMAGSPIAGEMARDLEAIVFAPDRVYGARSRAADALTAQSAMGSTAHFFECLLALGDSDSHRLAFEVMLDLGLSAVPVQLAVEILLAYVGLTVSPVSRERDRERSIYIPPTLFIDLGPQELLQFLDTVTDYAPPLSDDSRAEVMEPIVDVMRTAVLAALQSSMTTPPNRVWHWLRWVRPYRGDNSDIQKALSKYFADNIAVRRGVQATALLDAPAEDLRPVAFRLGEVSAGLRPNVEDIIALLERLGERTAGAPDLHQLRELTGLARNRDGLSAAVRESAATLAHGDPDFLRDMEDWSKPYVDPYEEQHKRRVAEAEAKRQETYRQIRADLAAHRGDVRAGGFHWLKQAAKVYLGRFRSEFSKDSPPESRVEQFLEPALAEDVLAGFMAALCRNDLPSPADIVQTHVEDREWLVEVVLACGIAEMIRRGIALDTVPRPALESAYMAWRRQPESSIADGVEIGSALEAVLLTTDIETEAFFQTSIEPQLHAQREHVYDLYRLAHDQRWPALAGRLATRWLVRYPDLPIPVLEELLNAAVRHGAPATHRQLVTGGALRVHASVDAMLHWLAADFVLDFDRARPHLADTARDDPSFLWLIRDRAAGGNHSPLVPLSVSQRGFIVEAFGTSWPKTGSPGGCWSGDTNPWNASEFIERTISSIAADPTTEATEMLARLLSLRAAPTYADTLRHALAVQRRNRRDHEYRPTSIEHLQRVTLNAHPVTVDDMRAYFGDRILTLQERMHATNTDMWGAYWNGTKPQNENFCRNRLIEHISRDLPSAIRFEPEMHMPNQKRADIAAIHGSIGLPVEVKGQWHREVWNAPVDQLAARYARDWHAEGCGVYIVLWFGNAPKKRLRPHPDGIAAPTSPDELRLMLIDRLPEEMRDVIDVYVIDVSRMC